jgi:hypothetical protein
LLGFEPFPFLSFRLKHLALSLFGLPAFAVPLLRLTAFAVRRLSALPVPVFLRQPFLLSAFGIQPLAFSLLGLKAAALVALRRVPPARDLDPLRHGRSDATRVHETGELRGRARRYLSQVGPPPHEYDACGRKNDREGSEETDNDETGRAPLAVRRRRPTIRLLSRRGTLFGRRRRRLDRGRLLLVGVSRGVERVLTPEVVGGRILRLRDRGTGERENEEAASKRGRERRPSEDRH